MRIAVFIPNWIGDAVMATPAIRALRERYPAARIVGVAKPYVAAVFEAAPWLDNIIEFDARGTTAQGTLPVARKLREESIDTAILFTNTFRSALTASLGRCRRIIGFNRHGRALLLTDRLSVRRDTFGRPIPTPIIDDYNALAERMDATPDRRMQLFTTDRDERLADVLTAKAGLGGRGFVAINPGAAFGSSKYWSVDSFAEVAYRLAKERDCGVLVLCGPSERELASKIANKADDSRVSSLADSPLSLGLTKALIRRSDLLITTDSGPRHFAAAFDRPVVTLFGPTHIEWTETYHSKAVHIQKNVDCGPCQKRTCPFDHKCMKLISPTEVCGIANQLLDRYSIAREGRHAG